MSAKAGTGGSVRVAFAALVAVGLAGCDDTEFRRVAEEYQVVGGQPRVDPSLPTVDRNHEQAEPTDFASSAPVQVDVFNQELSAKVDILWVIDSSGSMLPKQQKLRQNFQAFMQKLVEYGDVIDYHIGVVTTDAFDKAHAGRLVNRAGLANPWISPANCPPATCDAVEKFRINADVGIQGSGDEKGLLAAMKALSPPLTTTGTNAGFLRDDASLVVIILSDEEDSSCSPTVTVGGGGCQTPLQYGQTETYVRFFKGLKGFGREDMVRVGAIVATTDEVLLTGNRRGCRARDNSNDTSFFAPRYIDVATRTGGMASSICDADYQAALLNLGILATGLKASFLLSRSPYPDDIRVFVTQPGSSVREQKQPGVHFNYRPCVAPAGSTSETNVYNAIVFEVGEIPPAGSTIEVEYPVNVRGVQCPP